MHTRVAAREQCPGKPYTPYSECSHICTLDSHRQTPPTLHMRIHTHSPCSLHTLPHCHPS